MPVSPAGAAPRRRGAFLPLGIILCYCALVFLPAALSLRITPPGWTYAWDAWGYSGQPDYYSYLAKVQAGHGGRWQYDNRLTPEAGPSLPFWQYYLALGHLARLTGLSPAAAFELFRLAGAVAGMLAWWWFLGHHLQGGRRALAFVLGAFAAGFGFWSGHDLWSRAELIPAAHLWAAPLFFPHLMLDLIGFLTVCFAWQRWQAGGGGRWPALGAAGLVLVVWVHPYLGLPTLLVPGLATLLGGPGVGARVRRAAPFFALLLAAAAPLLVWYAWRLSADSLSLAWRAQAQTISLPWWVQALWFGLLTPLALLGAVLAWREPGRPLALFVAWFAVAHALVNLPLINNSLDFSFGLGAATGCLAARGLAGLPERRPWRLVAAALVALHLSGPLAVLLLPLPRALATEGAEFRARHYPPAYREGLAFLAAAVQPGEVVAAPPHVSLRLPYYTRGRAYAAHPVETMAYQDKLYRLGRFYRGDMAPAAAGAFLREAGIRWVVVDTWQPEGADWPLRDPAGLLESVYPGPELAVWRVRD